MMQKIGCLTILLGFLAAPAFAECLLENDPAAAFETEGRELLTAVTQCDALGFDFLQPREGGRVPAFDILTNPKGVESAKYLLNMGIDPNIIGGNNAHVVEQLVYNGDEQTDDDVALAVAQLADFGADVNYLADDGHLPLHLAAGKGLEATVEALLAAGADPNLKDGFGHCALHYTVFGQCAPQIGMTLIEAGARPNPEKEGAARASMLEDAMVNCSAANGGADYVNRLTALMPH